MFKTIEGNFENSDVNELLKKHFVELRDASPEGSAHVLDIEGLKVPSIKFWSLWDDDKLMGCGALKILDKDHGEFKSIRLHDDFRNKGNGIKLIDHLFDEAKKLITWDQQKKGVQIFYDMITKDDNRLNLMEIQINE